MTEKEIILTLQLKGYMKGCDEEGYPLLVKVIGEMQEVKQVSVFDGVLQVKQYFKLDTKDIPPETAQRIVSLHGAVLNHTPMLLINERVIQYSDKMSWLGMEGLLGMTL